MTQKEAQQKAQDWSNLLEEAQSEEQNGFHGAAERARNAALDIEEELRSQGLDPEQLLKAVKRNEN